MSSVNNAALDRNIIQNASYKRRKKRNEWSIHLLQLFYVRAGFVNTI